MKLKMIVISLKWLNSPVAKVMDAYQKKLLRPRCCQAMYDCTLLNADGKVVDTTVISKNILSTSKGKDLEVKILNNEYYLDLYYKK